MIKLKKKKINYKIKIMIKQMKKRIYYKIHPIFQCWNLMELINKLLISILICRQIKNYKNNTLEKKTNLTKKNLI